MRDPRECPCGGVQFFLERFHDGDIRRELWVCTTCNKNYVDVDVVLEKPLDYISMSMKLQPTRLKRAVKNVVNNRRR